MDSNYHPENYLGHPHMPHEILGSILYHVSSGLFPSRVSLQKDKLMAQLTVKREDLMEFMASTIREESEAVEKVLQRTQLTEDQREREAELNRVVGQIKRRRERKRNGTSATKQTKERIVPWESRQVKRFLRAVMRPIVRMRLVCKEFASLQAEHWLPSNAQLLDWALTHWKTMASRRSYFIDSSSDKLLEVARTHPEDRKAQDRALALLVCWEPDDKCCFRPVSLYANRIGAGRESLALAKAIAPVRVQTYDWRHYGQKTAETLNLYALLEKARHQPGTLPIVAMTYGTNLEAPKVIRLENFQFTQLVTLEMMEKDHGAEKWAHRPIIRHSTQPEELLSPYDFMLKYRLVYVTRKSRSTFEEATKDFSATRLRRGMAWRAKLQKRRTKLRAQLKRRTVRYAKEEEPAAATEANAPIVIPDAEAEDRMDIL